MQKYLIKIKRLSKMITQERLISNNTISDLSHKKELHLSDGITEREINNFIYINQDTTVVFDSLNNSYDERSYYQKLLNIFKILEKHNRSYNIKIKVKNRKLFKQSKLLKHLKNINLIIDNSYDDYYSYYDYSVDEFLEEEKRLNEMVKQIKESDLSPYEKYLAVYNKVKQFKKYKDNDEDKTQARTIKYILDNEYMVCVGYASLLRILLDKVDIPSFHLYPKVDKSYDSGFTIECIPTKLSGHQRNIVKIDDDKYNIHGIYIADPTWDNHLDLDLYNHALMTFDRMKESVKLEKYIDEDLLMDFHNFEEFSTKINFYIKHTMRRSSKKSYSEKLIQTYEKLYHRIMGIIINLDYPQYIELYNKYDAQIKETIKRFRTNPNSTLKDIDSIFSNYLTEYYHYIIKLSNQTVDANVTYEAVANIKKVINKHITSRINNWYLGAKMDNERVAKEHFPYVYNPNSPRLNYLSDASEAKKIRSKTN